jgi:hypothetical protein
MLVDQLYTAVPRRQLPEHLSLLLLPLLCPDTATFCRPELSQRTSSPVYLAAPATLSLAPPDGPGQACCRSARHQPQVRYLVSFTPPPSSIPFAPLRQNRSYSALLACASACCFISIAPHSRSLPLPQPLGHSFWLVGSFDRATLCCTHPYESPISQHHGGSRVRPRRG